MVFYENNTKNLEQEKFEQWLQVRLQTYIIHTLDFWIEQLQNLKYEVFYEKDKKLKISGSPDTKIIDRQRLATQDISMQLIHYSYFRFFVEQLQNLKYEVFYVKGKKNLKLEVASILKSFIHHIDAIYKFLHKKFNDGSVFCAFHFVNYHSG